VTAKLVSPAKINLGLEILGKRPDGYHEIRTILQAVSLFDELEASPAKQQRLTINDPRLDHSENLAVRAAHLWSEEIDSRRRALDLRLTKRIPAAAGLGGASSNAASVLMIANAIYDVHPDASRLHGLAARLGSDVPFFLDGPAAVASGRGDALRPIPPLAGAWLVLATPAVSIPKKTLTMYRSLTPDHFTAGDIVAGAASMLEQGKPIEERQLFNAFERPLLRLVPELEWLPRIMRSYGVNRVGLAGAGPTWYAMMDSEPEAVALATELRIQNGSVRIHIARPLAQQPVPTPAKEDRNDSASSSV
jgi:4-diphosphocytidyl-2-C-methyl-D-erythritol kinase